jgi:O-antigen biosynthesis protein WbqP
MKRIFDLLLGVVMFVILVVPMLWVAIAVRLSSKGPVLYWSDRVAMNSEKLLNTFKMPKFRTMLVNTPVVATHLLDDSDAYLTPIGGFLRRSSLDELPQLFSVLKGDMSFVGPRPALYNQDDLIALRTEKGVDKILPGITGWAQVNGRDELSIYDKVALEVEYLNRQSFWFDIEVLWMTFLKVIKRDGVSH